MITKGTVTIDTINRLSSTGQALNMRLTRTRAAAQIPLPPAIWTVTWNVFLETGVIPDSRFTPSPPTG